MVNKLNWVMRIEGRAIEEQEREKTMKENKELSESRKYVFKTAAGLYRKAKPREGSEALGWRDLVQEVG